MDKEKLTDLMSAIMSSAMEQLAADKEVDAVLFLFAGSGEAKVCHSWSVSHMRRDDETKDEMVRIGVEKARELNAKAAIIVSDTWVAGPEPQNVQPVDVPERREAIMVIGETRINGEIEASMLSQFYHKVAYGHYEEVVFGEKRTNDSLKPKDRRYRFLS